MPSVAVTGSASGLGAATRTLLEAAGSSVIGVDRRDAEVIADLSTDAGRVDACLEVSALAGGMLDGLVTCAGLGPTEPQGLQVSVNVFATFAILDGLRQLLAATGGAAVAIASNAVSLTPPPRDERFIPAMLDGNEALAVEIAGQLDGATVYGATKVATARGVRRRATAWGSVGVRLNAVAPGPVLTPLLQASLDDEVLGPLVDALPIPLDRRASPEEIASVIAFLLSPAASMVHGAIVFADGGTDAAVRPDI